jgi:hypothetical protein
MGLVIVHFDDGIAWKSAVAVCPIGVMVCAHLPVLVAPEHRQAAIGLINQCNCRPTAGLLAMDPDNGELQLRHSLAAPLPAINRTVIAALIQQNFLLARIAIPTFRDFAAGDLSPDEALQRWLPWWAGTPRRHFPGRRKWPSPLLEERRRRLFGSDHDNHNPRS